MANFPGAVTSFSAKNAGDTIQPSHINTLQDEVNAIEDGYINGTAPLNSSKSTIAALVVTGGSTLATLNVSGVSTFTGTVTFSSQFTAPLMPRCHAYASSTQTISSASTAALVLNTEEYDVGGLHSTASNPSRMTIPTGSSGVYHIYGQTHALSLASAGNPLRLYLRKNDSNVLAVQDEAVSTAIGVTLTVQYTCFLDATDYVDLAAAGSSAAWIAGSTVSVPFGTHLVIVKQR